MTKIQLKQIEEAIVGTFRHRQHNAMSVTSNIPRLLEERAKLFTVLHEMVQMMDCGDEPGAGSKWHEKAKAAIAFAESE